MKCTRFGWYYYVHKVHVIPHNNINRKIAKRDPTSRLTNKIQKKLCKENKFTNKICFELYPSNPIPPRLYGTINADNINWKKNSPMRVIVSTIGTPPYGISKYLADIIQPTLNKNQYKKVSKKLKIICFASSNMENWPRWNTSFIWCHKLLSINTHG